MLSDPHFKVLLCEQNSSKVFSNTDIKGGVAITYRDASKDFGAIGAISSFQELNTILKKVKPFLCGKTLDDIIVQQNRWNLEALYQDYPEYRFRIGSDGREKRLTTPIFSSLEVFRDSKKEDDITILGLIKNKRFYRYIEPNYIKGTWKDVPLQDFTPASDIDWSQSIADIDRQLYPSTAWTRPKSSSSRPM